MDIGDAVEKIIADKDATIARLKYDLIHLQDFSARHLERTVGREVPFC